MAKSRITIEVDHSQLFDGVVKVGTSPLGERLIGVLLDPRRFGALEAIGLGVYGIVIVGEPETVES
jgi:hypothetical protein